MNNKLFFTLTIIGTFLMVGLLFTQNQVVDAEGINQNFPGEGVYQSALNQLKSMVKNSESEIAQEHLESKLQAMEYKQSVQSAAITETQKSLEEVCKSIQMEETSASKHFLDEKPLGIFEIEEDFLGEEGYLINTMWRGEYSGYNVEIYAGSLIQDDQQGLVILNIPALSLFKVFIAPQPKGSLSISKVDGYRLQLSVMDGSIQYFDIPAQQFTQDLSKGLAVIDLPAAPTPIADPCAQFSNP